MSLPKVLIIGQPFTNNSGGGITQANLFSGWDKNKIAVVCTIHMFNNLNTELCNTYYLIGNKEYKWVFPFNLLQRNVISGGLKIDQKNINETQPAAATKVALRTRIINKYFYPFLEFVGLFHCISKITMSDTLCKWIDDYNPDVIYAQASSRETVLFCSLMTEYAKKPMVFHMMDDWPATISEKGPFKNYWGKKIDSEFRILLNNASVLLSISDYMAQEYKNRYGKDFITFHNPIEIEFWKSYQRKTYKLNEAPVLLYAGRIGPGIQSSLETIALAVDMANTELDKPVQFILQTELKPEWVEKYKCVKHKSLVAYKELPKVFAEADLLILPYDFSDDSVKFIKYSMPTKAPEYMMSGTPIIVYAPEVTAIVKDAEKNKWAKLVTENNAAALAGAVKHLCINENEREQIALNAISIAENKFNSVNVRNRFRETISSMVN